MMMEPAKHSTTIRLLRAGPPHCVVVVGLGLRHGLLHTAFRAADLAGLTPLAEEEIPLEDNRRELVRVYSFEDALTMFERAGYPETRLQIARSPTTPRPITKNYESLIALCQVDFETIAGVSRLIHHPPVVLTETEFLEHADSWPDVPPISFPLHPTEESETPNDLPPAA